MAAHRTNALEIHGSPRISEVDDFPYSSKWDGNGIRINGEGKCLLPIHQATLDGVDSRLGSITDAHFVENAADVDADGLFGDAQLVSDVAVALTTRNAGKHFMLPWGQLH